MRRNDNNMPTEAKEPEGLVLHNPGVCCVWTTRDYRIVPVDTGVLFRVGEPLEARWMCRGKPALRSEVVQAIERAFPLMLDEAKETGDQQVQALLQALHLMRQYLPDPGAGNERRRTAQAAPSAGPRAYR